MATSFRLRRLRPALFLSAGLLCTAASHAAEFSVGPPSDSSCQFNDLQAAINAAAASPGADTIRLSAGVYAAQRVSITNNGALTVAGGYADCTRPVVNGITTLDGQGASPAGPVISHIGSGDLTLSGLEIRNGNASGAGGGGLYSSSPGTLRVLRSRFLSNRADIGGGIHAAPSNRLRRQVYLEGVTFSSNTAALRGGGLYVANADVRIRGDAPNGFFGNHADGPDIEDGGGAIYARNASLDVLSRTFGDAGFISENTARSNGAGLFFYTTAEGLTQMHLGNLDSTAPLRFLRNSAGGYGGALYVRARGETATATARLFLLNTIIEENRANEGSAIFMYASGTPTVDGIAGSYLQLRMDNRSEEGFNACPAAMRCNRIAGNTSLRWATVAIDTGQHGQADFELRRGYALDNVAVIGGGLVDHNGAGRVSIETSVLAGNDAGGTELVYNRGELNVLHSTIADNVRVAPSVLASDTGDGMLHLFNSIVFQPGVPLAEVGSQWTFHQNLLVAGGHGLANPVVNNIREVGDPMFGNAPGRDYTLKPGSPAIDGWAPIEDFEFVPAIDLAGAPRPSAPPGTSTPYDFGAFEFGAPLSERIFRGTFEALQKD